MRTTRTRAVAIAVALIALALTAVPALAHVPVRSTFPARGSTVSSVRTVSVRFAAVVVTGTMTVTRAGGSAVGTRANGVDPRNRARLRATPARRLSSGRYTVRWRALAPDGHRMSGSFSFRVR